MTKEQIENITDQKQEPANLWYPCGRTNFKNVDTSTCLYDKGVFITASSSTFIFEKLPKQLLDYQISS